MRIAVNPLSGEKAKDNWLPYSALNVSVRHIISFLEYLAKSTLLNYLVLSSFLSLKAHIAQTLGQSLSSPPASFFSSPLPPFFLSPPPFLSPFPLLFLKTNSLKQRWVVLVIAHSQDHSQHTVWMTCVTFGYFPPTQSSNTIAAGFSLSNPFIYSPHCGKLQDSPSVISDALYWKIIIFGATWDPGRGEMGAKCCKVRMCLLYPK